MKYYGKFNDEHDLITVAKGEEIAQDVVENYHDSTKQNNITFSDTQPVSSSIGDIWIEDITPVFNGLKFTANTAGSTISMAVKGTPTLGQNFSYSTNNGGSWSTFTPGTTTITLTNVGDSVCFKGNNPNGLNESDSTYYNFAMTGKISASGNIMSLIDNGACNTLTIPNNYCFICLFMLCGRLTTPPELPATTLTESCYELMFSNCSLLTTSPSLPATTLAKDCYKHMFFMATKLTTPPLLPATTLAEGCYYQMFKVSSKLAINTSGTYEWRIPSVGTGVDATDALTDMLINTYGNVTGTPLINTTYYCDNQPV